MTSSMHALVDGDRCRPDMAHASQHLIAPVGHLVFLPLAGAARPLPFHVVITTTRCMPHKLKLSRKRKDFIVLRLV